jgi:hypothetical protein
MPSCVNAQVLCERAGDVLGVLEADDVGADEVGVGVPVSVVLVSLPVSVGTSLSDVALTEPSGEPSPDVLFEWHAETVARAATHATAIR